MSKVAQEEIDDDDSGPAIINGEGYIIRWCGGLLRLTAANPLNFHLSRLLRSRLTSFFVGKFLRFCSNH